MKKNNIINSQIAATVAQMGHFDTLAICDAGMPIPNETKKIDLALTHGIPSFKDVLKNILTELEVQKIYLAEEMKSKNPDQIKNILELMPNINIEYISHENLKKKLATTRASIRTGEMTSYSNIILESGVTF